MDISDLAADSTTDDIDDYFRELLQMAADYQFVEEDEFHRLDLISAVLNTYLV